MQEEIFGPLLPINIFEKNSDVISFLQKMPSPLAIYIMSGKKKKYSILSENTVSGGVGINELMLTPVNPNLPFGGVNNSGIGKSGGKHSFNDFSNPKGVVKKELWQSVKISISTLQKVFSNTLKILLKFNVAVKKIIFSIDCLYLI